MSKKKTGQGSGAVNLSGERGESPVLRVRIPQELLDEVKAKTVRTGELLPDVVRQLLKKWSARK